MGASTNIYDLYKSIRACLALGERGWLTAVALLNVALGGSTPVPDLVSIIPPGYAAYLTRVALVDDKVLYEVIRDVPLPKEGIYTDVPAKDEEGGSKFKIFIEKFPRAFGVFVECRHPVYGVDRSLWVVYQIETGDYPFKSFPAHRAVAERVAELLDRGAVKYAVEKPAAYDEIFAEVSSLVKKHGSVPELLKAVAEGRERLPEGVDIRPKRERP